MRWPFVSRVIAEQWEQSSHAWSKSFEGAQETIRRHEDRYEALVREMLAMRRENFNAAIPRPTPVKLEPTPSDEAINERAAGKPALRRHLLNYRDAQRRANVEDTVIADRIRNWRDPAETDD